MNEATNLKPYQGRVYRNIATLHPSQELMDDLVDKPSDQNRLKIFYYLEKKNTSPTERVLNRSLASLIQEEIQAKFTPQKWFSSRFSDGSWPVLYSAEDEKTALYETMFHARNFYKEEILNRGFIQITRRVLTLRLESQYHLNLNENDFSKLYFLNEPNFSSYPQCQNLASEWIQKGCELFRTPSARRPGGICTPIFKKEIIAQDEGHLKYLECILSAENVKVLEESETISYSSNT
ncbi:MAG: RES family NAD+ phosphorylase [Deltaproteobacteria bacterium]|nr:RES family NAD+ phosphorylase [Deltaproteobacteria bacterium]